MCSPRWRVRISASLACNFWRLRASLALWEDLKRRLDVLDSQVRSSLAALQDHVAGFVQRYDAETIASLTGYAYLVEAVYAL